MSDDLLRISDVSDLTTTNSGEARMVLGDEMNSEVYEAAGLLNGFSSMCGNGLS